MDPVASVLAAGDPIGSTADEIALALPWSAEGAALQHELEDLVARGFLDRFGVGRGALYALSKHAHAARVVSATSRDDVVAVTHRAS